MNTQREGFTLVELLVVAVLAVLLMGAAYQSLMVQERSSRAAGQMVRGQDALRVALGVLEAELREVVTHNDATGGTDLLVATRDSVVIRAQRKLGLVCRRHPSDRQLEIISEGENGAFQVDDYVLVFADGDPTTAADDAWFAARVHGTASPSATCDFLPGAPAANQRLNLQRPDGTSLDGTRLNDVLLGAPIRGLERVTYGLYEADDGGWHMGRRRHGTNELERLVDGLAGPGSGLVFTYLDGNGNALAQPISHAAMQGIVSVRIEAATDPHPGTGAPATELTTHIHLRNN